MPDIAEQIDHYGRAQQLGGAKRQVRDRADVLFKLRSHAAVHAVVAGVVWAGSHLVDDQLAVMAQEEFHGNQADDIQLVGDIACQLLAHLTRCIGDARWDDGGVQDVVHMHVLSHWESDLGAVGLACADHRKLADMVDPLLDHHAWWLAELLPECVAVGGVFSAVELDLAFAVITEGSGLDHAWEANGFNRGLQALCGVRILKRHAGQAAGFQKVFLPLAVLANMQRLCAGHDGLDAAEHIDDLGGNVFKLQRDDVDFRSERTECHLVGILRVHFLVGNHACGARALGLEHVKTIAEIAACEHEHAAELATAENTNSAAGSNHLCFRELGIEHGFGLVGAESFEALGHACVIE